MSKELLEYEFEKAREMGYKAIKVKIPVVRDSYEMPAALSKSLTEL